MEQIRLHVPAPVAEPRGAAWAAFGAAALLAAMRSLGLAARGLLARRDAPDEQPQVRTTDDVLWLARSMERHSPSCAAELRFIASHGPSPADHGG
jgi:hypothetical protein